MLVSGEDLSIKMQSRIEHRGFKILKLYPDEFTGHDLISPLCHPFSHHVINKVMSFAITL